MTNWTQFTADVRRVRRRTATWPTSVYGYFVNGGGNGYVVRVGRTARRRHGQRRKAKETAAAPRPGDAGG